MVRYSQILTSVDRTLLRTASIRRSRPSCSNCSNPTTATRCVDGSLQDVQAGKDPLTYIQAMMRDAKSCGMSDLQTQLRAIHESFDGTIRSLILAPDEATTPEDFLRSIRTQESTIKTLAAERILRRPFIPSKIPARTSYDEFWSYIPIPSSKC